MTNNMNKIKLLNIASYIFFGLSVLIGIALSFYIKDAHMKKIAADFICLMWTLFFSSMALESHFSGEFNIRGARATRAENPVAFYFAMFFYVLISLMLFRLFVKVTLEIINGG